MFRRDSMRFAGRSLLALVATLSLSDPVTAFPPGPQPDVPTRSKEAALKRALFEMRETIDRYYVDKKRYPKNLKALQDEGYLGRIPTDPFTGRDTWRMIPANPAGRGARQPAGIYDVKSRARGTALDGTRYSDW